MELNYESVAGVNVDKSKVRYISTGHQYLQPVALADNTSLAVDNKKGTMHHKFVSCIPFSILIHYQIIVNLLLIS